MVVYELMPVPMSPLAQLPLLGFEVRPLEPGRWQAQKGNCAVVLEGDPLQISGGPGYLIGGEFFHLVDRGYQKFLEGPSRTFAATAQHLHELHAFERELRAVLHLKTLYNESLGTVSEHYQYDRVKGRE